MAHAARMARVAIRDYVGGPRIATPEAMPAREIDLGIMSGFRLTCVGERVRLPLAAQRVLGSA